MSITTYAEVKQAVADYLARSDLTSYIPDFIVGAETRIAYGGGAPFESPALRIRAMETSADMTFSARTASLPTGFLEMRRVYWSGNPNVKLDFRTPEMFWAGSSSTENGTPMFFTVEGDNMAIAPYAAGTAKILYYKKFTALATDDSEWLLANAPHVYVYGALLEAAPFIRNDPRIQLWHGLYRSAVHGLNLSSKRDRFGGNAMMIKSDAGSI